MKQMTSLSFLFLAYLSVCNCIQLLDGLGTCLSSSYVFVCTCVARATSNENRLPVSGITIVNDIFLNSVSIDTGQPTDAVPLRHVVTYMIWQPWHVTNNRNLNVHRTLLVSNSLLRTILHLTLPRDDLENHIRLFAHYRASRYWIRFYDSVNFTFTVHAYELKRISSVMLPETIGFSIGVLFRIKIFSTSLNKAPSINKQQIRSSVAVWSVYNE